MSNNTHGLFPVLPWVPVDIPPSSDSVVLIARKSGYIACDWELMTAQYRPDFRPKNPWVTVAGDAITDSGHPVMYWRSPPALPTGPQSDPVMPASNSPVDPSSPPECNLNW